MNVKKIVTSIVISVLISAGLYYGIAAVAPTEAIRAILTNKFDLTMCVMMGVGFGVVYLLSSYRKAATPEADIPMKKYEYLYNQCDAELKAELDKLSDEDKLRYVESTEALLDNNKKNELNNYVFKLRTPQKSASIKIMSRIALIVLVAFASYTGYETFSEVKPALDEQKAAMNATYDDQVLYIDGLPPIQLISGGTFNQLEINEYIEENIKTQPAFLLKNAKMIVICRSEEYEKLEIVEVDTSTGYSDPNNMTIYIRQENINSKGTISHELSHLFDYVTSYHTYSNSPEFQALYNAAPNSITEYGATNVHEFFAEAGMMYVNSPSSLKSKNIDVYNYFNNLFGQYM